MSEIEGEGTGIHATAVVYGESGVLILGPSGSGKSALALALLARARDIGVFGALVGDDRVWARAVEGRLVASGSPKLAGLIERRAVGLVDGAARAGGRHRIVRRTQRARPRLAAPAGRAGCRDDRRGPPAAARARFRPERGGPGARRRRTSGDLSRRPMRSEKEFRLNIAPQCTKMARLPARGQSDYAGA